MFDADAEVHKLYAGKAAPLIEEAFPGTTSDGVVDRNKLSSHLLANPEEFVRLEAIVHPLVGEAKREFLKTQQARGAEVAVLEIPLLFEAGAETTVDVVVVVSADAQTQAARVLERPGMTTEKLAEILARQLADEEKRRRADFVVDTGQSLSQSLAEIDSIVRQLKGRKGQAYQRHWM